MSLRDFALLVGVCLIWASNNVVSKFALADLGVPPFLYAVLRFIVVVAITVRWLLPAPRPYWRLYLVGALMGAGNFGLLFIGMKTASISAVAIVAQVNVPLTALFSVLMLGERIRPLRGAGIVLTLLGVLVIMWDGGRIDLSSGLLFVVAGCAMGSLASVMLKQLEGVRPLQMQAWVSFSSLWPLMVLSAVFERDGWSAIGWGDWRMWACVAYSAVVVSLTAHTLFYGLLQRYEATLVSPLTLMVPIFAVALGALIYGEALDARLGIGAGICLVGVLMVVLNRGHLDAALARLRGPGVTP